MTEIWVCFCVFFLLLRPNNKNAECTVFLLFLCIYCCFWLDIEIRFRLPAAKQFDGYSMCECMIIMCIGIRNGIRFTSYTHISNKRTWVHITNTRSGARIRISIEEIRTNGIENEHLQLVDELMRLHIFYLLFAGEIEDTINHVIHIQTTKQR